jgi:hypothetical protein
MSRYTTTKKSNPEVTIEYGFDNAMGYFYQEWVGDADEPLVDLDSFSGLGKGKMVELLIDSDAPESHIKEVTLDLPI